LSQTSSQKNKFRNSESPELRHSWRVYILPYLGYQSLFDKYDFNEPWNGANNCKLQAEMPREYECALQPETGKTPFKMVSERSDQNNFYSETCHDGATQTVAMIEDRYNQINWMSLNDIDRDAATNLLNQNDSRFVTADESLFFDRYRGIKFSLASCKIIARPRILPHPVPQAIFTRDGGENCTEVISTFVTAYS
jgi:hypothetical protein